jgi:hAT family C-terminal dimerisation region/Domain of unknown function (DUF4413)
LIDNGVYDKKLAITLDNASNNDSFIEELIKKDHSFTAEHHVRCFGHILNLAAKDALALVDKELSGVRNYLKVIVSSPKRLQQLNEDFTEQGGSNYVKPILDVPTRWNSTVHMIKRALRLKVGLAVTMDSMYFESVARYSLVVNYRTRNNSEEGAYISVTDEHWENFQVICDLLEPLRDATEVLSGQHYPTLSMVVPVYNVLLNHLEAKCTSNEPDPTLYAETANLADAAKAAYSKLNKYYDISSELCTMATVLDPRLKLQFYKDGSKNGGENPGEIREYVRSFYDTNYASILPAPQRQAATKGSKLVDEIYGKKSSSNSTSELDTYLEEPVMENGSNFDLLDYWRVHSTRFPSLSRMARDYLAVPATSTPSERVFSAGRQLITDFRCRLKAETITACMLLKDWFKQPGDVLEDIFEL